MSSALNIFIGRIAQFFNISNVVENVNLSSHNKNCLLVYIKTPFQQADDYSHQNNAQVRIIAKILDELEYNVDVIDYRSKHVFFKKEYDAVFDICVKNEPVYKEYLKESAKRVVYFTGSESKFANNAEIERIKACAERRGVRLQPRRQAPLISKEVEKFDEAILIGDEYNLDTYKAFKLPKTFLVPNTGYDFKNRFKSGSRKTSNFLFFGSAGCVHKGLDLLLEIFSEKDFPGTLYVCGNFDKELDFLREYEKELYHTDNIKPIGFVDIWGEKFTELCELCTYTILPSCSEGMAGTIVTCMSAGLIPICSKNCGYSDNTEIITLSNCSKECIRNTVLESISKDKSWIDERSDKMLELVKTKYSINSFETAMRKALSSVF